MERSSGRGAHMAKYRECKNAFEFKAELKKAAKVLGVDSAAQAAVILALQLQKRVTEMTPVRTGRARANWFLAEGAPRLETTTGTAVLTYSAEQFTGESVIYLTNSLPYIVPLEYGHSGQAPNGMLRIAIAEIMASLQGTE